MCLLSTTFSDDILTISFLVLYVDPCVSCWEYNTKALIFSVDLWWISWEKFKKWKTGDGVLLGLFVFWFFWGLRLMSTAEVNRQRGFQVFCCKDCIFFVYLCWPDLWNFNVCVILSFLDDVIVICWVVEYCGFHVSSMIVRGFSTFVWSVHLSVLLCFSIF